MQPLWKILAPVELNDRGAFAMEHAMEFAHATKAQLVFVYVAERGFYKDQAGLAWPQPGTGEFLADVPVRRSVLCGDPAAAICRYADFIDANMVLMMPRERRAWPMFRRRSVTAAVLHGTRRPVQVWRQSAEYRFRCRKLLCVLALDGSDGPLIDCAMALASRSGAEVAFLHVLPEISESLLTSGLEQPERPLSRPVALDRMRELGGALPFPYSTSILVGGTAKCISLAARQTCADLVIVGRSRQGSGTGLCPDPSALLRRVSCPVISAPVSAVPADPDPDRLYRRPQRENVLCDV